MWGKLQIHESWWTGCKNPQTAVTTDYHSLSALRLWSNRPSTDLNTESQILHFSVQSESNVNVNSEPWTENTKCPCKPLKRQDFSTLTFPKFKLLFWIRCFKKSHTVGPFRQNWGKLPIVSPTFTKTLMKRMKRVNINGFCHFCSLFYCYLEG